MKFRRCKGISRVFCRCCPLSKAEVSNGCSTVVGFDVVKDGEHRILHGSSTKKTFKFDRDYKPRNDQGGVENSFLSWSTGGILRFSAWMISQRQDKLHAPLEDHHLLQLALKLLSFRFWLI